MMSLCANNIVQIGIGARASVTVYALLAELTPIRRLSLASANIQQHNHTVNPTCIGEHSPLVSGVIQEIDHQWQYNSLMFTLRALLATLLLPGLAAAQQHVSFPTQDGGVVYADIYGKGEGERGVLLPHGGRFNKESWEKQA